MSQIDIKNFIEKMNHEKPCVIDVRTKGEFEHQSIGSAICLPLDEIDKRLGEIPGDKPVYMICRSGKRSQVAVEKLQARGFDNVINVQGGMQAYAKMGGGDLQSIRSALPVMRQVQMVAGFMVLLGVVLSWFVAREFIFLSGFVGIGLMFAGITGYCPLGEALLVMPWNRESVSKDSKCCGQ